MEGSSYHYRDNHLVFHGKTLCEDRSILCLDLANKSPDDLDSHEKSTGGTDTEKQSSKCSNFFT